MRVAIQGIAGCFSAAAAALLAPGCELLFCPNFENVFAALGTGAQAAVVPVKNSIVGAIAPVQALLAESHPHRHAELWLPIDQCLIAAPGSSLTDIGRVLSHPVALAQCGRYLNLHPGWRTEPFFDTAGSVREVVGRKQKRFAAIAGALAAEVHGAVVLEHSIGDRPDNQTLFWLITAGGGGVSK